LGLSPANRSHFHPHFAEPRIAVTPLLAVFCGTTNSRVDKWNTGTSGHGRYERFQVMERMDAPIKTMSLSSDSHLLLVVLADNSLVILNTASLAVVSRPQSLQWPSIFSPFQWLGLSVDIENPNYVITNTRIGYIQWLDPVKWKTVGEVCSLI
jgi:hypothetical protein